MRNGFNLSSFLPGDMNKCNAALVDFLQFQESYNTLCLSPDKKFKESKSSKFRWFRFLGHPLHHHIIITIIDISIGERSISEWIVSTHSLLLGVLARHDMCPKFYTTGFSGQKFYIIKVRNVRHCSLTIQMHKCIQY